MVAKKLGEVDPHVNLSLTYEDEGLNFIGVCTYNKDGEDADFTIGYEDIMEISCNSVKELEEWWDEDEQDWKEEFADQAEELFNDVKWDIINDWQMENKLWSIPDSI
jgi:hypothetical protein